MFLRPQAAIAFAERDWVVVGSLHNLTGETVAKLELAPAGTQGWGPDQCKNDKDGTVDNDERLKVEGVAPGSYDARLTFKGGRVCYARGLAVEEGKVFSVELDQLKDCEPK